jgi:hypothetical protein
MLGRVTVLVAACSFGVSGHAHAGGHISMRWNAPDSCPDDAQLIGTVEGFLGQRLSEAREQELAVGINVQGGETGYSAKLKLTGPNGADERFLEHPDCGKLMEAAALVTALAIDPERVKARQAGVETATTPALVPAASAPQPEPVCPAPVVTVVDRAPPFKEPALGAAFAMSGFVGFGTLPRVAPGVMAEAGFRAARFRFTATGRYWVPNSTVTANRSASQIELSLVSAGLRACTLPLRARWSLLGCVGAELGDMAGSGQGVDNARTKHATYAGFEASLLGAYRLHDVAPFAGLGLSVTAARPRFGILRAGEPNETFQPSRLGLMVYGGVSYGP